MTSTLPSRGARRRALSRLALGGAALAGVTWSRAQPGPRLPALRRGLNLTHWFEYEQAQDVSPAELRAMRLQGFDHVRLPVDPVVGGWRPEGGGMLGFMPELQRAIAAAIDAGLDVVVDLHPTGDTKRRIEDDPQAEAALVALWTRLARDLSSTPPERVAFELLNEPQYYGMQAPRWPVLQRRLLQAVRARLPAHLVLLTGNQGGSLEALLGMPAVSDDAVAWVFHYYDPYLFTHQGASWLDPRYTTAGLRRDVRYPADVAARTPATLRQPHPRAAREWADYLGADWGPRRIRADVDRAGQWARQRHVRLLCNEFGVIRAQVDPASRYRWIGDVRSALEANGIGWTLWDYTDIFGITPESAAPGHAGQRTIEPEAARALGLAEALR